MNMDDATTTGKGPKRTPPRKAVILAGGGGTRFHPVSNEIPKPLIPVGRKPVINYSIENFERHGVTDMKVIVRPEDRPEFDRWLRVYGGELLRPGVTVEIVEEAEPMGTFGFIATGLGDWAGAGDELFVTNSDDIKDIDLGKMYELHAARGGGATVAVTPVANPEDYGAVILDDGAIKGFLEKSKSSPSNIISIGTYIVSPDAVRRGAEIARGGRKFIMIEKDIFPKMAEEGKLFGFMHEGTYEDCGTLEKWLDIIAKRGGRPSLR